MCCTMDIKCLISEVVFNEEVRTAFLCSASSRSGGTLLARTENFPFRSRCQVKNAWSYTSASQGTFILHDNNFVLHFLSTLCV
jgi:hypothetical protein